MLPLKPPKLSAPMAELKVPVLTGTPLITTQPSYTQADGRAGKVKPVMGLPDELSRNHTPLYSSSMLSLVGVAKM